MRITYYTLSALLLFSFSQPAATQGRRLSFERSSSIDVITKEKIETVKTANVVDILKFSPTTHHLDSRVTTYNLRGAVDKNRLTVFYDGQNQADYIRSEYIDPSGVTIRGMEESFVDKVLKQGYKWDAKQKSAETYNEATRKYDPFRFTPNWKPVINYTPVAPTIIKPVDNSAWHMEVQDVIKKNNAVEAITKNSFGGRGEVAYIGHDHMETTETKLYDAHGTLRQYIYREYYSDDWMYEEITDYDCDGYILYFESTLYDDWDYEISMVDIAFKDGKPVAGWRDVDDYDADFRQYYDPLTNQFEYINDNNEDYAYYRWKTGMEIADEPCDDFDYDWFFFGPSLISEDANKRFNTIGVEFTYTKFLSGEFGLTAASSITFGSQFNVDYTKINVFAGVTCMPFKGLKVADPLSVGLVLVAGLTSETDKYSQGNMSSKSSRSLPGGFLGLDVDYDISKKWGLQGMAGWNPAFPKGGVVSNYLLSAGLRYQF